MKKITVLMLVAAFSAMTASRAADSFGWTENWESYTSGTTPYDSWALGNGTWMPVAGTGQALDTQAYHVTAGGTSRIGKNLGFAAGGMTTITLDGYFYDGNGTSSSKRSWLGFQDAFAVDGALLRIGMNNVANYQVHYYEGGALKTVDTGLANAAGWHYAKLTQTMVDGTLWRTDWQINLVDAALNPVGTPKTGSFTWAWRDDLATKVVLGYNYSSTVAVDWDNISITAVPEPSTLALALLGGFGLLALRRR